MTGGLSKLGASLIAVFVLCVVILAADLAYVLWRRRRFHRRSSSAAGDSSVLGGDDSSVYVLSSKELLYFFCWKNQSSRIEPNDGHRVNALEDGSDPPGGGDANGSSAAAAESEDDDLLKLQEMYRRSRLLFTIKEEEETSNSAVDDQKSVLSEVQEDRPEIGDAAVVLTVEHDENATPFSTPCASPPFYTPSPSPSRDEVAMRSHESYGEVEFISLDINHIIIGGV